MAEHAVAGEFSEGNFGDQLRLDPMRAAPRRAGNFDRRFVDFQRLHPIAQVLDQVRVEARPNLTRIGQLASVARRQVERAEAPALVARLPADDDELLPLSAFDLQPIPGPLPAIGGAGLLRDDPLAAFRADGIEQRLALADDMVAVDDRGRLTALSSAASRSLRSRLGSLRMSFPSSTSRSKA